MLTRPKDHECDAIEHSHANLCRILTQWDIHSRRRLATEMHSQTTGSLTWFPSIANSLGKYRWPEANIWQASYSVPKEKFCSLIPHYLVLLNCYYQDST